MSRRHASRALSIAISKLRSCRLRCRAVKPDATGVHGRVGDCQAAGPGSTRGCEMRLPPPSRIWPWLSRSSLDRRCCRIEGTTSTPPREPRSLTALKWVSFFGDHPAPSAAMISKVLIKPTLAASLVRRSLNAKRSLQPLASPRKCASCVTDHRASSAATSSEMPKKPLPLFFK
jgi:hypothetical protein